MNILKRLWVLEDASRTCICLWNIRKGSKSWTYVWSNRWVLFTHDESRPSLGKEQSAPHSQTKVLKLAGSVGSLLRSLFDPDIKLARLFKRTPGRPLWYCQNRAVGFCTLIKTFSPMRGASSGSVHRGSAFVDFYLLSVCMMLTSADIVQADRGLFIGCGTDNYLEVQ